MTNDGMAHDEGHDMAGNGAEEEAFWAEETTTPPVLKEDPVSGQRVFDLEERTTRFGEAIVEFALRIPQNPVTNRLISQLVGAGTSVGANYCEADDAYSRNEFRKNIAICKKEARETKFQLRMVVKAVPELKPQARMLWQEAKELHLIFAAILRRTPRQ
jgi:four helix bundle protein